jgi:hypothetical protein
MEGSCSHDPAMEGSCSHDSAVGVSHNRSSRVVASVVRDVVRLVGVALLEVEEGVSSIVDVLLVAPGCELELESKKQWAQGWMGWIVSIHLGQL